MPKNTGIPLILGALTFLLGFGLTWRMWWLCALSLALIIVLVIIRSFDSDTGYTIPADEVERMERGRHERARAVELPQAGVLGGATAYGQAEPAVKGQGAALGDMTSPEGSRV